MDLQRIDSIPDNVVNETVLQVYKENFGYYYIRLYTNDGVRKYFELVGCDTKRHAYSAPIEDSTNMIIAILKFWGDFYAEELREKLKKSKQGED